MTDDLTTGSMLYLDGVTVSFDGFKALNNLSLTVAPGEMRAIIGPNGAGKTTMMDVVTGKTRPDDGEVFFNGTQDLTALDETQIAELGIGRKFQQPTVFEMHTVEDNILLALKSDRSSRATLFWRANADDDRRIENILQIVRLSPLRERIAGGLSHGQKQWLEIGMLLAQEPKLLLVDEPVAGMTDAETRQTVDLLKEINRDRTVVVVEHEMEFVRDSDKLQRLCSLWGLHRPRTITNAASLMSPLARTRALVAEGHGATIFAFAGTDPLVPANWLTDLDFKLTPGVIAMSEATPGNFHRGFQRAVNAVWEQIVEALRGRREQPVLMTGHSLGAALAAVAADRALCDERVAVRSSAVYCFGMPRAGDEDFALRYNDALGASTYRLVHGDDIVATVPPSRLGFRHVGKLICCPRAGKFGADVPAHFCDDPPFVGSLVAGLRQGLRDFFKMQPQPTFRDDPLGRMSGLLAPPIADHLPDRYWSALAGEDQ